MVASGSEVLFHFFSAQQDAWLYKTLAVKVHHRDLHLIIAYKTKTLLYIINWQVLL